MSGDTLSKLAAAGNLNAYERTNINARITNADAQQKASIIRNSEQRPKMSLRLVIPLDTAATDQAPMIVGQPFNGFYVENSTTSTGAELRLAYGQDKYSTDNYTVLGKNDSSYSREEIKQAVLIWTAQAGKTITIIFYLGAEFRPGSLVSEIEGGLTQIDGSSMSVSELGAAGNASSVSVLAGLVPTVILAADADRKVANLQTDIAIRVGDSIVSATTGFEFGPGPFQIRNTGIVYAIPSAGGPATVTGTVES